MQTYILRRTLRVIPPPMLYLTFFNSNLIWFSCTTLRFAKQAILLGWRILLRIQEKCTRFDLAQRSLGRLIEFNVNGDYQKSANTAAFGWIDFCLLVTECECKRRWVGQHISGGRRLIRERNCSIRTRTARVDRKPGAPIRSSWYMKTVMDTRIGLKLYLIRMWQCLLF